jgi:hypothetical protein
MLSNEWAPIPTKREAPSAIGKSSTSISSGEGKIATHIRRNIDGPETIFEV